MDQGDVLDILPTSVRSRIWAFRFLRFDRSSTSSSSRRHSAGKGCSEELVVTSRQENEVVQVAASTIAEAETGAKAASRRKAQGAAASGIHWRYAEQGTSIQRTAYREREDPDFCRKAYVDGATYMLMALPDDLSDQELARIREALPRGVADTSLDGGGNARVVGWRPPSESRTILQRCVASFVAISVVLVHIALSYAAVAARVAAYYERKHSISQQLVDTGFVIAAAVGRHGVVLSAKIYAMKKGRVGKAMSSIASWTVEGVTYGIQEGIGQGMIMANIMPVPIKQV
ncbi:hypothetical protein SAMD00023353_0100150 [Rosellinia necatrix]|uniref:Uncharacterized protein n=1 Tax=Rosellinia necatrix TaxID=77044 RepID=A0A1S7UH55_ROSNE|nr:hypothetical protein SAMD00023353_0100150 [Rosellinia necatrix]